MEREVEKLQDEITYLKKRVASLESKENRRKAFSYLKTIGKIIIVLLIAYGLWRGYDYFVNGIPRMMEEKIQEINPFKKK